MEKKVWYIPPKREQKQKTAGIYCRVSSNKRDQLNSLTAQISALVKTVSDAQWSLEEVFIDIASANGKAPRKEFDRMLRECESEHIDVILTKSISRFGRDTAETLDAVRRLKNAGTRVIFMEENIDTNDYDSDLMISVLESFAQAENESRSENIRWGLAKRAASGSSGLYRRRLFGYAKDEKGNLVIDEEQAGVVQKIFKWYIEGYSVLGIIENLRKEGIPSPTGKEKWSKRTIEKMLENEKYTGTVTLLDSATQEYYYQMKEAHPQIISDEDFRKVKSEKKKRSNIITEEDGGTRRSNRKYSSKRVLKEKTPMLRQNMIKTNKELEFAVFCIENLAAALHTDARTVYRMLCDKSSILTDYIAPEYEALHTQSKDYIIGDIMDVMKERGVSI